MTLLIILISVIILLTIQNKFEIIPREEGHLILAIVSVITFFHGATMAAQYFDSKQELNKYINYVENYQQLKESGKVKDIELEWDSKIRKYKHQNNGVFDSYIPDKKLNEAIEARNELLKEENVHIFDCLNEKFNKLDYEDELKNNYD